MDWTVIITSIVSCLTGGSLSAIFFYPQMKKGREIDNDIKIADQLRQIVGHEEEQIGKLEAKVDQLETEKDLLHSEINRHRDEKVLLRERNVELEVENTRLKLLKCEVPACPRRKPPTGY